MLACFHCAVCASCYQAQSFYFSHERNSVHRATSGCMSIEQWRHCIVVLSQTVISLAHGSTSCVGGSLRDFSHKLLCSRMCGQLLHTCTPIAVLTNALRIHRFFNTTVFTHSIISVVQSATCHLAKFLLTRAHATLFAMLCCSHSRVHSLACASSVCRM